MESIWYENFSKFEWVKEFVFSLELEQDVALAGVKEEVVLIDVFGNVLEEVSND